jgi:precorrin-2 dehydrogenase/sirohydrochlorin ferrochelatase
MIPLLHDLARELRRPLEPHAADTGALAEATATVRTDLKRREVPTERRRDALRAAVRSPVVWKDLGAGGSKDRTTVADEVESAPGETE